ncbi:MAG: ABC transporter permease, partial [Actinomycetota bacterium]
MTPLATEPLIRWDWVGDHASEIGSRLIEHVELTVIAIVIGFAISFPLAVLAHRRRWTYAPITWVAGVLYTIPSLSLFVILVPITGLSATSVEIGLVSYTLLILIRNTVAGLGSVPADAVDSARGMGFSSRQMLWHVEVPLALPV